MSPGWESPACRHLGASPDRAELRVALGTAHLSRRSNAIYLVGEDGPMENRPVADGTMILWPEDGRWFIDDSERGAVSTFNARSFDDEPAACRWLFDRAYISRYESAGEAFLGHLQDVGAAQLGAMVQAELAMMSEARHALNAHPRVWQAQQQPDG